MEKVVTTKLFTIVTKVFLEQALLDVNLDSNTIITLKDGRYTNFHCMSGSINLTSTDQTVNSELVLALQILLNDIARKVATELEVAQRAEIGATWKK